MVVSGGEGEGLGFRVYGLGGLGLELEPGVVFYNVMI